MHISPCGARCAACPSSGGCWNCGGGNWGAAAAGAATGLVAGTAIGAAAAAPVYVVGGSYAVLPGGCGWQAGYGDWDCAGTWFRPAYGANGAYYYVVPAP